MKPFKKQIKPNQTKNNVNEKNSAQSIGSFFKAVPKSFVVEENVSASKPDNDHKKFYVDILKEKLRRVRNGEKLAEDQGDQAVVLAKADCSHAVEDPVESESRDASGTAECTGCAQKAVEMDEWKQKYIQEVEHRKELKKVYLNLTIRFSELHSKYDDLSKVVSNHQSVNNAATSSDDIFTPKEVQFLQCMELDKKTDCTFILQCLKYGYKPDRSVLATKSLKGTAERTKFTDEGEQIRHEAKTALTPEKVDRIKGLFIERISKCKIDAAEYAVRMKDSYVNKLFAAGVNNISTKFK